MMSLRRAASLAVLATLVLATACGTTEPEALVPATLAPASAPPTAARITDTTRVVVRVLTAAARPVAGQVVTFTPGSAGTVSQASVTTDASGDASTTWTFGPTIGLQQLVASVGTLPPLTLVVNVAAGPPASLTLRAGNDQTAAVGTTVSQAPSVIVRDVAGNPVSGMRVAFVVTGGGGRLSGDTVTTDTAGVATLGAWTLGTTAGANALVVRVVGAISGASLGPGTALTATLTATAIAASPARISAVTPRAVVATVGSVLGADVRPTVAIADAFGNPVGGATVSFSTIRGGVSSARATTSDTQGIAVAPTQTVDTVVGVDTLSVTAPGTPSITFTIARRAAAPAAVWTISGDRQVVAPGDTLPEPLVVQVTDRYHNPIPDVVVTFEDEDHVGLAIGAPVQRTDAQGTATSGRIVLSKTVPWQRVSARAAGVATPAHFVTVHPPEPATRVEWRWDASQSGVLQARTNQRTAPVAFVVANDVGNVSPTTIQLEVIPASAGTVYVFGPGTVTARSTVTATDSAETVVQVQATSFVGQAVLRATVPSGSRYDLPFVVSAPPKP